ncbi:hypothetical protein E5D57_004427 [Metarhizium anisopliae]|nr:hypothetical protein E5D57_004427 [Metarhizium anisopliae]
MERKASGVFSQLFICRVGRILSHARVESTYVGRFPYPVQLPEGVDTVTKAVSVKLNVRFQTIRATSRPQELAWAVGFREHATQLGKYLWDSLLCIERAKDQPVPHDLVKIMAMGALSLVNKIHSVPDFSSVHDALQMARTESKTAVESTMQALDDVKQELKQAANTSQQTLEGIRTSHEVQNETKAAASESKDIVSLRHLSVILSD